MVTAFVPIKQVATCGLVTIDAEFLQLSVCGGREV